VSPAVVFDLDDTLVLTDRDRSTLLSAAADRAGVSLTFDRDAYLEAHREHSGTETRQPVFEALAGSNAPELTRAYREVVGDALVPVEGAAAVVKTLRQRHPVGLLTDGPGETQHDKLRRLGWQDAFDAVVVTGPIEAPKPDQRAFEAITERLGADPGETVHVGDDPKRDVGGAIEAGLLAVQVLHPDGPEVHPDADAAIRRADLDALPALVEDLLGDSLEDA
jgi:putative hydrolase of the HAD superfamily